MAFRERIKGDRAKNIDKSLEHYVASEAGSSLEELMPGLMDLAEYNDDDNEPDELWQVALDKVIAKLQVATKEKVADWDDGWSTHS